MVNNLHSHVLHHYVFLLGQAQCLEDIEVCHLQTPSQPAYSLSKWRSPIFLQNTKKSYSTGMRQFYSSFSQTGLTPTFPIDEDILINFSVCMARSVTHSSIKNYLLAIKHYHSSDGYQLNLSTFFCLQLILRGIKRSQGDNSKTWRPITLQILNLFYHLLNVKYTNNKDSLMVWVAMTLAFFGFLPIGELTCDSHFNPECHLSFSGLVFMPKSSPRYMLVQLKVSKTDPFRKGQTIVIGKGDSHLCPLSAMLAYLDYRTPFPTTGPLFTFQSGSFLWTVHKNPTLSSSTGSPDSHRAPVMSVISIYWDFPILLWLVNGRMLCICGDEVLLSWHFCPQRLEILYSWNVRIP